MVPSGMEPQLMAKYFSGRIVVNQAGDYFLTHAALAYDEHAEVGGCHLKGDIQRMVQRVAVSHDVVALLYPLQFVRVHNWVTKLRIFFQNAAILAVFLLILMKSRPHGAAALFYCFFSLSALSLALGMLKRTFSLSSRFSW